MNHSKQSLNRRNFLGEGACSLLGSSAVLNTLLNLSLANSSVAADADDYKALVCVFLFGGNDSFNMLIPASAEEHQVYAKTRDSLAVPLSGENAALRLKQSGISGRDFALNPAAPELLDLYEGGDLAFLANVGTLVEPTTITQYQKKSVRLPKSLFSHNDQRDQWQTSLPQMRGSDGWLGRAADQLRDTSKRTGVSMNISLSGNNLLQTGKGVTAYNITPNGSVSLNNTLAKDLFSNLSAPKSESEATQRSVFEKVFAESTRDSIETDRLFSAAFNSMQLKTPFPAGNALADSLKAVARSIGMRKPLGQRRQTFFVMLGGWDNHQDLLGDHPKLLSTLSQSLAAFNSSLAELGVSNKVTTFTASDFGRTLRSNGRGSDHAWGGNSLIMGGAVKGGRIHGQYPEALLIKDGLDVGTNGRLLPTTSCDEYFWELLRWFGVPANGASNALPNLANFFDANSGEAPIGFLKT
ncbi:DUF1501 domain-containing protein [bacterium]|nr:DUF1501 domain-containing protein [bacterium]